MRNGQECFGLTSSRTVTSRYAHTTASSGNTLLHKIQFEQTNDTRVALQRNSEAGTRRHAPVSADSWQDASTRRHAPIRLRARMPRTDAGSLAGFTLACNVCACGICCALTSHSVGQALSKQKPLTCRCLIHSFPKTSVPRHVGEVKYGQFASIN